MHPDLNIKCSNGKSLIELKDKISLLKDIEGKNPLRIRYEQIGNTINFVLETTPSIIESSEIIFKAKKYKINEIGIILINRDIGSAYHTNKGIFISNKKSDYKLFGITKSRNTPINTTKMFGAIKDLFGI